MTSMKWAQLAFSLILLVLLACSSRRAGPAVTAATQEPVPTETVAPPAAPPREQVEIVKGNPLATSELALMMRAMADFTDTTRKRLAAGGELLPFPTQFNNLRTAEATPGMVDRSTFDPYAQAWQYHLNALYQAPEAERVGVFNALVGTCAACHGHMCPGPLVRINKMGLPQP
ncbi:MAG: hypothetical protein KBH07_04395 [Flavobacteriales bacterium]|nr:hypothetical protein [Flavobacteriales bacterium]MBP9079771.1 hypothetical protein [Flavobacteriales bacterium]